MAHFAISIAMTFSFHFMSSQANWNYLFHLRKKKFHFITCEENDSVWRGCYWFNCSEMSLSKTISHDYMVECLLSDTEIIYFSKKKKLNRYKCVLFARPLAFRFVSNKYIFHGFLSIPCDLCVTFCHTCQYFRLIIVHKFKWAWFFSYWTNWKWENSGSPVNRINIWVFYVLRSLCV